MASASTAARVPLPAAGGTPGVILESADGARAEIALHGGQVVAWMPAGERESRLFMSSRATFASDKAIRGGIPVSFPQFADQGPLPGHGFARVSPWTLARTERTDAGAAFALLRLADTAESLQLWPYAFVVELGVTVSGRELQVALTIANPGATAFPFTGALHTYLRVADTAEVTVTGLQSARYRDKVLGQDKLVESAAELRIDRPLDRVYYAVPDAIIVREPGRSISVHASGFCDTVIWNPGEEGNAKLTDLEHEGWRRMVCVEAAVARAPTTVPPHGRWQGMQKLVAA
jgi:glucose-6-phosphate 1-epimerase